MFKSSLAKVALVSGAVLLAPIAQAFDLNDVLTDKSTPYTGMQSVALNDESNPIFNSRTYHEGQNVRMDLGDATEGMSVVMKLIDGDSVMLMHEMSAYKKISGKMVKQFQGNMVNEYSNQQEVGRETVNGVSTIKYTADQIDPGGKKGTGTYWLTEGGILVRSEVEVKRRRKVERTITNLTDIEQGDQADELFEVPASYQAMSLGALFSGANRQANSESAPVSDQERAQDETYQAPSEPQVVEEPETRGKKARKVLGRLLRSVK